MAHCIRSGGLVLLLMLVLGAGDAADATTCVAVKAPSAPAAARSDAGCATDWSAIRPADFKEPIANPHRLGWQEWTALACAVALLGVLAAVVARFSRRWLRARWRSP